MSVTDKQQQQQSHDCVCVWLAKFFETNFYDPQSKTSFSVHDDDDEACSNKDALAWPWPTWMDWQQLLRVVINQDGLARRH